MIEENKSSIAGREPLCSRKSSPPTRQYGKIYSNQFLHYHVCKSKSFRLGGNAPKKLRFGGGCTRAAGVGSPDERGEEPYKARSQEDAPRVKRAPVGATRCCAGFPSPAEQYLEPLGAYARLGCFPMKNRGQSLVGPNSENAITA